MKSTSNKIPEPIIPKDPGTVDNRPQTSTGVKTRRALALEKEKLNLRYKGIHQQTDKNKKENRTSSKKDS